MSADYLRMLDRALVSRDGFSGPSREQLDRAESIARVVQAVALDRIAAALEAIANPGIPDDVTIQAAIRHSL